jgi:hypothetical protein
MKVEILPKPKKVVYHSGQLRIPTGAESDKTGIIISDECARPAAELLAEKFKIKIVLGDKTSGIHVRLNIVNELDFARDLRADLRVEAYCLEVTPAGIDMSALTSEGLLRATATLLQMRCREGARRVVPFAVIKDWPNFRYRCASDWLVNVEANRWAYDWGDGRRAFLKRIKHNLEFCFEHKINMVWFDGFGWDINRFPGYAPMMKECNRYARRFGVKLLFGGYGGGYGTAYQEGEIYRCGYFGRVYLNRRPYPDGKKYACRGWPEDGEKSRFYGTCLSNDPLRRAKIEEMKRFVSEVNPGFMYVHEIDAGTWMQSSVTWKNRCAECRKRWPNDELAAADGQAGAFASWFRQVRRELSALPGDGDYLPARDLTVAFVSPLYTEHGENKPENVWEREMRYYQELSRLIGPEPGILFGLREQYYEVGGRQKKIGHLREKLDRNGNGHGLLVAAFAGGDNYYSDDLVNISGSLAHFYDGAEAVYISNGGVHQEPIQMMNADFLWNGFAGGYRENPRNEAEAEKILQQIKKGTRKPPALFAAGGYFDRLCRRLWGAKAGRLMSRALQAEHDGQRAVGHVWWSITKALAELKAEPTSPAYVAINCYEDRKLASQIALGYARRAAMFSKCGDIRWFIKCLEVGKRFAGALDLLFRLKLGYDQSALLRLDRLLRELKAYIRTIGVMKRTDILGGEPGCWGETIAEIQKLGKLFAGQKREGTIFSDFIHKWLVSQRMPADARLSNLKYPLNKAGLKMSRQCFPESFCDLHEDRFAKSKTDACVFFATSVNCRELMKLEFCLGYDGPVKVWLDGRQVFHDPNGTNPGRIDKAIIPWEAALGNHELMIALGSNRGKAYGIFARFRRSHDPVCGRKHCAVNCVMLTLEE